MNDEWKCAWASMEKRRTKRQEIVNYWDVWRFKSSYTFTYVYELYLVIWSDKWPNGCILHAQYICKTYTTLNIKRHTWLPMLIAIKLSPAAQTHSHLWISTNTDLLDYTHTRIMRSKMTVANDKWCWFLHHAKMPFSNRQNTCHRRQITFNR